MPPPPPPNPPPPPMMGGLNLGSSANTGQERNMLLESIRQGKALKKTVTVDKSAPLISGKVAGSNVSSNNNSSIESSREPPRVNGGPPGLAGLFAGGMPKLKPTGLGIAQSTNRFSPEIKNRGPPPQPPPASQKPTISSSASDSTITSTQSYTHRMNGQIHKAPAGGYGKPNVAPKPPSSSHQHSNSISGSPNFGGSAQSVNEYSSCGSVQNLHTHEQNGVKTSLSKLHMNRPIVSRAHSMRSPRSPPATPTNGPPYPTATLVKNKSGLHQSTDSLVRNSIASRTGTLPSNYHNKMAPMPPTMPPPPTPNLQRGTPTKPPGTKPPPPPSRFGGNPPPAPPTTAPPPPPHRASPAPNPPKFPPAAPNLAPPAPPVRNSSMRNGSSQGSPDLEARFGHLFHSYSELPHPIPFRNVTKTYNSRNNATKQQAPPPPVPNSALLQLGPKWASNTSQC